MVMWLVRWRMRKARPMARGWIRFRVGPSFTYASRTTNRSTSRAPWFCCALARAERRTFSTMRAACFLVNRTSIKAWLMFLPRIRSTTKRAFRAGTRTNRAIALASMASLPALLEGGGAGRVGPVPLEGPRGRELAQLVPDHVLRDVNRDELLAVVHGQGVADELRQDRR